VKLPAKKKLESFHKFMKKKPRRFEYNTSIEEDVQKYIDLKVGSNYKWTCLASNNNPNIQLALYTEEISGVSAVYEELESQKEKKKEKKDNETDIFTDGVSLKTNIWLALLLLVFYLY